MFVFQKFPKYDIVSEKTLTFSNIGGVHQKLKKDVNFFFEDFPYRTKGVNDIRRDISGPVISVILWAK